MYTLAATGTLAALRGLSHAQNITKVEKEEIAPAAAKHHARSSRGNGRPATSRNSPRRGKDLNSKPNPAESRTEERAAPPRIEDCRRKRRRAKRNAASRRGEKGGYATAHTSSAILGMLRDRKHTAPEDPLIQGDPLVPTVASFWLPAPLELRRLLRAAAMAATAAPAQTMPWISMSPTWNFFRTWDSSSTTVGVFTIPV